MSSDRDVRVLVVDNDLSELLVIRRLLMDTPYRVDAVRNKRQALGTLNHHRYAAVIAADGGIPDSKARALLSDIGMLRPETLRVLLTAEGPAGVTREAGTHVIPRPFFARPLRALLVEHADRLLRAPRPDETLRTGPPPEMRKGNERPFR